MRRLVTLCILGMCGATAAHPLEHGRVTHLGVQNYEMNTTVDPENPTSQRFNVPVPIYEVTGLGGDYEVLARGGVAAVPVVERLAERLCDIYGQPDAEVIYQIYGGFVRADVECR